MSKCHIVGNHMSWFILCVSFVMVFLCCQGTLDDFIELGQEGANRLLSEVHAHLRISGVQALSPDASLMQWTPLLTQK